jgi:serine/threonine-protein kinase
VSANRPRTLPPHSGPAGATQYFGQYELLAEIARGGMGVVYKARQKKLNRIVALKMILSGQFASASEVQRFYTEAEAAANLQHPGIIPIYEIGQHDGKHFFSMAFIAGKSLADRREPMPPREAAEITMQVADAIAHAHQHNVIHRDLKPANILVDSDGKPKVTDFGLAKKTHLADGLTATGQILGTPSFMPPEQATGQTDEVGPAADIYSLGAVLYALLTGRPPFQAANVMDTLKQVIEIDPVPPRRLNSMIHADLETICLTCLAKSPQKRYESASELRQELQRFLNGEPIRAKASTILSRTWSNVLSETRHIEVMAMWSRVWCWHSFLVLVLFAITGTFQFVQAPAIWPAVTWAAGIAALCTTVWYFRFRSGVRLTPIEIQLGQVWMMFAVTAVLTGVINHLMQFEPLELFPIILLECGFAFCCMAAILGGSFYPIGVACFAIALIMPLWPAFGIAISGLLIAVGLLLPAMKYSPKRLQSERD